MPTARITDRFVHKAICTSGRRTDYFDETLPGFVLEVRKSGGRTFYVRIRDAAGRQLSVRIGSAEKLSANDARQVAESTIRDNALGAFVLPKKAKTFAAFMREVFIPHQRQSKKMWEDDRNHTENHLIPFFGDTLLPQITQEQVLQFRETRVQSGLKASTCNNQLATLRYALKLAVQWGHIRTSPAMGVKNLHHVPRGPVYLNQAQLQCLYRAVEQMQAPNFRWIIAMLILTGARRNEVLNARWDHIDLNTRRWHIPSPKQGKPHYVPLSDEMLKLLSNTPKASDSPYLFPNPATGKPYTSVFHTWNIARYAAGLPHVRLHDLRHTFASLLINTGRTLHEVGELLGHRRLETTRRYAHLEPARLLDAANLAAAATGLSSEIFANRSSASPAKRDPSQGPGMPSGAR